MKIIEPSTEEEWKKYYDLRYEVLRKPLNQLYPSTKDNEENITRHFLMLSGEEAVATGRLKFNSKDEAQIRSMAVRSDRQGGGLGSAMVKYIESLAKEKKVTHIVLDARENAIKFYEKLGYKVIGDSYLLFGLIQHYRMRKDIIE